MKKFIGVLLSLAMTVSSFVAVNAEETETIVSLGATATSSSTAASTSGKTASNLFDGTGLTKAEASTSGTNLDGKTQGYIQVDLGKRYHLTKFVWTKKAGHDADTLVLNVYGSNDPEFATSELIGPDGTERTVTLVDTNAYRYVRIVKEASTSNLYFQPSKMDLYGYESAESNANLSALAVTDYSIGTFAADVTEYTVYTTSLPTNNAVTVTATAANESATVAGIGSVTIKYGINTIPVTVTAADGATTKTYTIKFVVTSDKVVSLGATATSSSTTASTSGKTASNLFDGTGLTKAEASTSGTNFDGKTTGYIQVDLGARYNLTRFVWTKSDGNDADTVVLEVQASNDSTFATYDVIGPDVTSRTVPLDATNSYQYVRIYKGGTASTYFRPTKMTIYGMPEITQSTEGATTTVTVPCGYYSVGDKIITAVYKSNGELKSVVLTKEAENAASTAVTVTKDAGETAKVMIWNSLSGMTPRVAAVNVQ